MKEQLRRIYHYHKYKLGVFLLLIVASVICVSLVVARRLYTGSHGYTNLIWNLFLAWIPFVLAFVAYLLSWRRRRMYFAIPAFAFLWLIFFPNAPYILTDLQHLGPYASSAPTWYDVILLIWFSWTGMLLGIVSLNLMQEIIRREMGRGAGWVFVVVVSALTGIGIYLGRFLRVNSWDIFQNPALLTTDIPDWITDPSVRSVGFIGLYTLFFIFVYLTLYAFGHILNEEHREAR